MSLGFKIYTYFNGSLVHKDSLGIKYYHDKNNPSKIIEQDFEKLSKTVLEDSSFPKEIAENLEIILIHKTDEKNDMLSTYCARFYKKIFENKIKTVKQRASL